MTVLGLYSTYLMFQFFRIQPSPVLALLSLSRNAGERGSRYNQNEQYFVAVAKFLCEAPVFLIFLAGLLLETKQF